MGKHVFGNAQAKLDDPNSNRNLLIDFCRSTDMVIANSFIHRPVEQMVTYYNLTTEPLDDIVHTKFAELDHVLCKARWLSTIGGVRSWRKLGLSSHHFLVLLELNLSIEKKEPAQRKLTPNVAALSTPSVQQRFGELFLAAADEKGILSTNLDGNLSALSSQINECLKVAAAESVPSLAATPQKPWISQATLNIIESRGVARRAGQHQLEQALHCMIRAAVRADKQRWLNDLLQGGWLLGVDEGSLQTRTKETRTAAKFTRRSC